MEPKNVNVSPKKLEALANKLSLHFWNKPCEIPVVWNGRLTKTMGRFVFSVQGKKLVPLKIEISKHAVRFINHEIFVAVLLHELCHYHLFITGKPYQDRHPVFEQELSRVGAISTNTVQIPQKGYILFCSQCQKRLGTRKRMNTKHYLSACCRARIRKQETWLGEFKYDGRILKHNKVNLKHNEKNW